MKIIEKIAGSAENIIVYENSLGAKISFARPKLFSFEQMIAEIEETENKKTKNSTAQVKTTTAKNKEVKS